MNEVYFPALFPGFPLPEELVEALGRLVVVHAELDRETRTIRLDAQAEQYLAEKQLQALCRDIEKEYGLRELKLSVRYPASELPNMDFRDLAQVFIRAFRRLPPFWQEQATRSRTRPSSSGSRPTARTAFCRTQKGRAVPARPLRRFQKDRGRGAQQFRGPCAV